MSMEVTMIKIRIDGKYYDAKPGKNLLETCLALGLYIPHFCFHPALGSVGACRLCAVKKFRDQDDKKGRIIMSCMEPVTEGLIVSIEDPEAKAFRAAVIESLMTNHPHDCPVCDEGGECHLQDMTVMTGHNYRRFDFNKRTYNNQYLGPFINHEMNRCIQCYRCVRFYRDYAGGKDLNVFASHNHIYFGRHKEGILENEFSGNLVEVCPTGVFTDKTLYRHFTRKWDLSNAPSVCVHCSVGCNIIASERYGSLRRIMNRYNGAVNGYFVCDRGRFGYDFVNSEKRIRKVKIRFKKNGPQEEVEDEKLLSFLETAFSKNKRIIGIGSPRASIESNYSLSCLVGKSNFFHGIQKKEQRLTQTIVDFLRNSGIQIPSLKQIEKADAVIILGEDLTNTVPMIALALRQAARNKPFEEAAKEGIPLWNDAPVREMVQNIKSPIFIATPCKDSLDELAETTFRASYAEIAGLGYAIASSLSDKAPIPEKISKDDQKLAKKIAESLKKAKNPLIISGITSGDEELLHAGMNIVIALLSIDKMAMFTPVLPECNSMGLAFIPGKSIDDALSLAVNNEIDTLIILENDLYRRAARESVDRLFDRSRQIIVLDHLVNQTTMRADILIPASTFAESEGTLVNYEGRAQRYHRAIVNKEQVKESWRWINKFILIKDKNQAVSWTRFDDIVSSLANDLPVFSKLREYMPSGDFRMLNTKIPRQTMRYSGRTAMNANIEVSESRLPQDHDSPLAFSMEGQQEYPPSSLVPFYWTPGWNSVQAMYNYLDEPNGSMKGGDPGIRLIEPAGGGKGSYFKIDNEEFEYQPGIWLVIPVYQFFGSDELSSVSTSIVQRIQEPFLFLNQKDAEILSVKSGEPVHLEVGESKLKIHVIIENSLQQGIAGLSVNLPGMPFIDLPGHGKLIKL
jgi:NADH-quinone oxidoreductase subunit G